MVIISLLNYLDWLSIKENIMTIKITALAASIGAAVAVMPFATQAEITVLKQDPQAGNPLSRLTISPSAGVFVHSSRI